MTEKHINLRFQQQPTPVLPEHRPLYKIAQVLLVLHIASRAGSSSLAKLHLFNWAFKASERDKKLLAAATTGLLNLSAWGFDSALAIALRYASAEGLVVTSGSSCKLTDMGQIFARAICAEPLALTAEREILNKIGKKITETMVDDIAKEWESR